jgi:hypothetical protein
MKVMNEGGFVKYSQARRANPDEYSATQHADFL